MTRPDLTVIVLDDGSPEAATSLRRASSVAGLEARAVAADALKPWDDITGGLLVLIQPGDGLVDDQIVDRCRGVTAGVSRAGAHILATEWGASITPPEELDARDALIHCPVELASLTIATQSLPDRPELAPGLPGGAEWLVAHLLTNGSIHMDTTAVAVCSADLRSRRDRRVESRAALAATRLAHELGATAALRQQLAELTWLSAEGGDAPTRWWEPVVARNDPDEVDALITDLTVSLDHVHARLVATVVGLDGVIADQGEGHRSELDRVNPDGTIHRLSQVVERLSLEMEGLRSRLERADAEARRRLAEVERLQAIIDSRDGSP